MSSASETVQKFQNSLDPYIKPREQVNYIRRVLALHLGSGSHDGHIRQPLSLVNSPHDADSYQETTGIQREYIEALAANASTRREFDEVSQASTANPNRPSTPPTNDSALLEERLCLLRLQKKRQSLLSVQKYLASLSERPAAKDDFLHIDQMFFGTAPLPSVPRDVINSLVAEQTSSRPDLENCINQLEKTVLRAKLLLKQDEKLLREAQARCKIKPDVVSYGAKLEALNATRNELINWIETELAKASSEEPHEDDGHGVQGNNWRANADESTIATHLDTIKDKYAQYISLRKRSLALIAQRPPSIPPPRQNDNTTSYVDVTNQSPVNHLLTPYLESLLTVSRNQKAILGQKNHANSALSKQTKETCQQLVHLAEESQLLPAYPMKDSLRRRSGIRNEMSTKLSDQPDIATRIKPWVFAADSAKMATLESVAEAIEIGQVALENSMNSLQDVNRLLGRTHEGGLNENSSGQPADEDVWLGAGKQNKTVAREHSQRPRSHTKDGGDAWSTIHGSLGLIGHDAD